MNILEFSNYLHDNKPQKIIYKTELQRRYSVKDTLRVENYFDRIQISISPALIYLCSGEQSVRISRVKRVYVEEDSKTSEKFFVIVCGDKSSSCNDTLHKLLVI